MESSTGVRRSVVKRRGSVRKERPVGKLRQQMLDLIAAGEQPPSFTLSKEVHPPADFYRPCILVQCACTFRKWDNDKEVIVTAPQEWWVMPSQIGTKCWRCKQRMVQVGYD